MFKNSTYVIYKLTNYNVTNTIQHIHITLAVFNFLSSKKELCTFIPIHSK